MKYNIAVVGATGMVGEKMLEIIAQRGIPIKNLYLYASGKSAGQTLNFCGRSYEILELKDENIKNKKIHFALFAIESDLSKIFAPKFVMLDAVVIDNSSAFRMNENVPLVVPEVNFETIKKQSKIIANPNCSTIQAVVALAPLHNKFKIKRIVYSTYQAVSGAGVGGIEDLKNKSTNKKLKKFLYPICDNLLPHIDSFDEDGYTKEELKLINETQKILGDDSIKITATAVRVPIFNSHSESINVEFEHSVSADEVKNVLKNSSGIIVLDDIKNNIYPMPKFISGKDEVYVGRIRNDKTVQNGINMWVVADNIRKGAATNAVQILERLIWQYSKV